MVLLNNFNRSYLAKEMVWSEVEYWFRVEIFFIAFNICHTLFFLYINMTAKQFHQNWTNVMSVLYIQHSIADCAWIIDRLILIGDATLSLYWIVRLCSYIRVICIFQGLLVLPILIIERLFATFYISDYETKKRVHISYILLAILFVLGCASSVAFHEFPVNMHLTIITTILTFNTLGGVGNVLLFLQNRRIFKQFYNRERDLSLTERFQISENIKTCRLVTVIVITMGGFNVLICFTIFIDFWKLSENNKNICTLLFDISAFLYSTLFPYICMRYSIKWKHRFHEIFGCALSNQTQPEIELHDTFGTVMNEATSDLHFEAISKSWNLP